MAPSETAQTSRGDFHLWQRGSQLRQLAVRICWSPNAAKLSLPWESASLASSVDLGELQSLFLGVDSLSTSGFLFSELFVVEIDVVFTAVVLVTQLVFGVYD